MSRLIRIFTVCLVILFYISIIELCNKQGGCPNLAVCPNIPDSTVMCCCYFSCLIQALIQHEDLVGAMPLYFMYHMCYQ